MPATRRGMLRIRPKVKARKVFPGEEPDDTWLLSCLRIRIPPDTYSLGRNMLEIRGLRRLHIGPLDLSIESGTCVSISGKSGAGKSVLLRMIADLDPHEGEVFLDGAACSQMPATEWRRQVTYVAAESGWWSESVREHFPPDFDANTLLPHLGLQSEVMEWPVAQLSTGERQRLALLRAIRPSTRVLLLDEPTSALDPDTVGLVEHLLKERLQLGISVVLVTHDKEQARRMATRHLALMQGKLEELSLEH